MPKIRLDKLLAERGVASRRELKEIIRQGRVKIDGEPAKTPDQKLDPELQRVTVDGAPVRASAYRSFMLDKPLGYVTATEDAEQQTVMDLFPPELRRIGLSPVGRLDKDTSGLLLLTNDGDLAHRVISPRSAVEKRYHAKVDGVLDESDVSAFREGIELRDGTHCLPAGLEILSPDEGIVSIKEGKYHQVRRMFASRGKPVLTLRRLSIGALQLDPSLGPGGWKELDEKDLCTVFSPFHME
ncbi:MAG: rRNA pseudouridine synthase [Oscillospiraceae bacterium]|nr:rRNA pseudouridine synthase [Oscillospiraceae bacterium]